MQITRPTLFFLTAFTFLITICGHAQTAADDSLVYKKAVANLIALYHDAAGDQSGLYNGSQYGNYGFSFTEGHPFFYTDKPGMGSVVYDGIFYNNVMIQFDEVQEAVVVHDTTHHIQLLNERLEEFSVFNNRFRRIIRDTLSTELVRTGYYNVLYEGNDISLLKKQEKSVRDDVSTGELRHFIDTREYYYLKKSGKYYSIKSKGGLLDLLKDKRKEIRQFINKNDLSYRKDRQNMLTRTTAYYDQLTH